MFRSFLILLPVLLLTSCRADRRALQAPDAPALPEGVRQDWLDDDREMIASVRRFLDPLVTDLAAWRHLAQFDMDAPDWNGVIDADRDLGFGGRLFTAQCWGGYCSCDVQIIAVRGDVAALQLYCGADAEDWPPIQSAVRSAWRPLAIKHTHNGVRWTFTDPVRMAAFEGAVAAELGAVQPADVPANLRAAYSGLMDARTRTDFGDYCYFAGVPPWGREAITSLVHAGRYDLVRNVLRSPNPEARIYAAEALLRSGIVLDGADRTTIEHVRALTVPISTCRGCFVTDELAADLLSAEKFGVGN